MVSKYLEDKAKNMDAVDHEARRMAQDASNRADRALDRIDANQKSIESAQRRQELFETEMRTNLHAVSDKVTNGHDKLHDEIHHVETETLKRLEALSVDVRQEIKSLGEAIHGRINTLIRIAFIGAAGIIVTALGTVLMKVLGW